jgi:hypothetical protein
LFIHYGCCISIKKVFFFITINATGITDRTNTKDGFPEKAFWEAMHDASITFHFLARELLSFLLVNATIVRDNYNVFCVARLHLNGFHLVIPF